MSNDPNCPFGSARTPEAAAAADAEQLRMLRRVVDEWNARAVGLGHDGIAAMLDVAEASKGAETELLAGWKFNHCQQSTEDESDEWELGWLDEDGGFSRILSVDTGLYFQPQEAEPLARAILARLISGGAR